MADTRQRSESPEMESARDRLGDLLESIRQQNMPAGVTPNGKRSRDDEEESDEEEDRDRSSPRVKSEVGQRRSRGKKFSPSKSGPGSISSASQGTPSSKHPQKKIIFELRQKAFEIQNSNVEHGLYALCRIWMRGKASKDGVVSGHPVDRSSDFGHESIAATKAISRKSTVRPEDQRKDATKVTGNEQAAAEILRQYLPRWRQAKKDWCQQRNEDDVEKYGDSLRVLGDMYASAQNHVIM